MWTLGACFSLLSHFSLSVPLCSSSPSPSIPPSLPVSAGNSCPADPHKYLLIANPLIHGAHRHADNLRVHVHFSNIRTVRGQMVPSQAESDRLASGSPGPPAESERDTKWGTSGEEEEGKGGEKGSGSKKRGEGKKKSRKSQRQVEKWWRKKVISVAQRKTSSLVQRKNVHTSYWPFTTDCRWKPPHSLRPVKLNSVKWKLDIFCAIIIQVKEVQLVA